MSSSAKSRFKVEWFDYISLDTKADYVIKGLFGTGGMSMVYGPSGCGKSFLVTDSALAVARGVNWFGMRTKTGSVLYVAAEGQMGFKKRAAAYRERHLSEGATGIPFALLPVATNLLDGSDASELVKLVLEEGKRTSPFTLVIVDTLNRTMPGDENDAKDMGRYIDSLGKIQASTGAHVCVIHHTGKNAGAGARGHSSLIAAVDTAIEVEKGKDGGPRTATIVKQKDGLDGNVITFDLETVELGADDEGDQITSCVVVEAAADNRPAENGVRLSKQNKRARELLIDAINRDGQAPPPSEHIPPEKSAVPEDTWRAYCEKGHLSTSAKSDSVRRVWQRCREELIEKGVISCWDGWVWLV